jgi:hypothetical protein
MDFNGLVMKLIVKTSFYLISTKVLIISIRILVNPRNGRIATRLID